MLYFNIESGYLEGILRGYKSGLLSSSNYMNLVQCENLEDVKLQLASTEYGNFLQNEPSPISPSTIVDKAKDKLIKEFLYLRAHAVEPLATFMDYLSFKYLN
jgi:V-type H+-transporting ATPase subunit d